jgi:hypothetical protein
MAMDKPQPNDTQRLDPDRIRGEAEDYKATYGPDDETVDYEKRTHGENRRI